MTDTLIARLRDWRGDPDEVMSEAANLIEALHAELKNEQRKVTELVNGYEADQEEIRKLRAEVGQYPEIQAMLMKENKELRAELTAEQEEVATLWKQVAAMAEREIALQSRLAALEKQEPVAYEFRMRADWVPDWGLWSPCNKEHHEMYIRAPKLHDWVYETRALFLAAGAAPTVGLPFVPWSKESEMRESWAQAAPQPCTNDEWLANCPQSVRDFAAKIKAEQGQT